MIGSLERYFMTMTMTMTMTKPTDKEFNNLLNALDCALDELGGMKIFDPLYGEVLHEARVMYKKMHDYRLRFIV